MCPLSNPRKSTSPESKSGKIGNSQSFTEDSWFDKELIQKANTVPLTNIFKAYGLKLSSINRKTECPFFSRHQEGKDSTASFLYYPDTNSFWCFGCKTGSRPCDLVAILDKINRYQAADKILRLYGSEANIEQAEFQYGIDVSERLDILMEFSELMRVFLQNNSDDSAAIQFMEKMSISFDSMNTKHKLSNQSLKILVSKIIEKVNNYGTNIR